MRAKLPRLRAPLLWIVLPMIVGIALARALDTLGSSVAWLGLALGMCAAATAASFLKSNVAEITWRSAIVFAAIAGGAALLRVHEPDFSTWENLPAREATLTLRVEQVYSGGLTEDTVRGIAEIIEAPALLGDTLSHRTTFAIRIAPENAPLLRTSIFRAQGVISPVKTHGAVGFERYLRDSGVRFRFTRTRLERVIAPANSFQLWCERIQKRMAAILAIGVEPYPREKNILTAMLLGRTSELAMEQRELFLRSGTMHLFAISGLHVVVIAAAVRAFLGVFRMPSLAAALIVALALWLYVQITGAAPSAMRAWTMVALVFASKELRWPGNALAGLATAAFAVLLVNPMALFGAGFQMSYGVVAALLLYGIPLGHWLQSLWRPFAALPETSISKPQDAVRVCWIKLSEHIALCIAATIGSVLPIIGTFNLLTPGAILANLILIPVSSLVLISGIASLVSGLLGLDFLSSVFNHAAALLARIMEWLVVLEVEMPGAYLAASFRWSWFAGASLLVLMLLLLAGYSVRWRKCYGGFFLPILFIAILLLLGLQRISEEKDLPEEKSPPSLAHP